MAVDSGRQILFISYILTTIFPCLTNAQPEPKEFEKYYCNYAYTQTYDSSSVFGTNLENLTSILNASSDRFYNFSIGQDPDTVYVIALCRGDVAMDICSSCLSDAYTTLRKLCPNEKESIRWDDNCMLRYWDQPIFHMRQSLPNAYARDNSENVSNALTGQYKQAVRILLDDLLDAASKSTSVQKFAIGKIKIGPDNDKTTIYALAECTPDLSGQDCRDCLDGTREILSECCDGRFGGRVVYPSCNFRYERGQFYRVSTNEINSKLPQAQGTRNIIIIIVIAAIIFLVLVIACIWIIMRKRKQKKKKKKENLLHLDYHEKEKEEPSETLIKISMEESLRFDFDTIKVATDNFSDTNKLGQGGCWAVYKGTLRNGRDVAVKWLSKTSNLDEVEFENEVVLLANLRHMNLVELLGFCLQGTERLLIYEFIHNASLDHFIFEKRRYLNWSMRYKIIEGIARGLLYLQEDSRKRKIHRDLKASNILLDAEMNPKIADFGIARMFGLEESHANTKKIDGTYGYMAPEYARHRQFSIKSDVFSFGVLVLEIVSGQKNNPCFENADLRLHAWKNWSEETHSKFIDPTLLDGSTSMSDVRRCIHIGLLCVQDKTVDRPTMASVANMLSSMSLPLQLPTKPAFSYY